ncbi:MAG: phage antirepressor Ant [Anaerotignum sp.]|nr:phage antirepressor Ant [Anaerotignum sp.]
MNEILNISGIECFEKDGTAYLKLETVARGLGFTTVAASGNEVIRWNTVHKYLCDLGVATSCNGSSYQNMCPDFIPENIFYRLAMKAKNETAEKFQAFVADEIIPSIRRHGIYATAETVEKMLSDPDTAIRLLNEIKSEREKRIALEEKAEQDKPLIAFANSVSVARTSILIGELAKLLKQNGIDMGQNRLFAWMREKGYLISRKGTDYNMPTQRSMERGLFEIKESTVSHADGHTSISKTPKITGKGQIYFINLFLGEAGA